MNIDFKWSVGDKVKVTLFDRIVTTTITARSFWENGNRKVIEYETDLLTSDVVEFTQEELEKYN
ncbi:hypothetical protein GCM10008931_43310 [Oceanobacillus oncorhynchi subsp. oncorhynchi]|uniref:hypothetical protein n=1 Tax=Oceanobacillus oncorhynchi TaxID=545501 RepID=UPI0031CDE65F